MLTPPLELGVSDVARWMVTLVERPITNIGRLQPPRKSTSPLPLLPLVMVNWSKLQRRSKVNTVIWICSVLCRGTQQGHTAGAHNRGTQQGKG